MKAIVYHEYGSPEVLELQDIEKPIMKSDELLVRVHAASVNWLDWHFLTGTPFLARFMAGLLKPKHQVLGIDLAGRIEEVGAKVMNFQRDDQVFGSTDHGCFAEYTCVAEENLVPKPENLTFEEAATVPGAAIPALQALRDHGKVQTGQKVLINGASGGLGTFAVQIAKSMDAEVTGVCSTRNLDLVRSIGADHIFDYTQQDFTQSGFQYDLVFDTVAKRSFAESKPALKSNGVYITTAFSPFLAIVGLWQSIVGDQKMTPLPPKPPTRSDLVFMKDLLESGKVKPIIDKTYPLSEVPEALRYLHTGHARGKIAIKI